MRIAAGQIYLMSVMWIVYLPFVNVPICSLICDAEARYPLYKRLYLLCPQSLNPRENCHPVSGDVLETESSGISGF